MSLQAYRQTASRGESARETEYRLFAEVTRALMSIADAAEVNLGRKMEVLDWNRQIWMALADDCAAPANTLPPQLRAQIISLSLWVRRHTSAVMRNGESVLDLIEVNRAVMQGLGERR
jgi:flagellar biosynthesis activator protein FlaF